MITIAAKLLRDVQGEEKPTVVMLVDRNELETQLFRNITAYGIGTVQVAQSKEDLRRILRSDYRGLVVSMIHKFDRIDADMCPRGNVVVLVDEAHRTTGGDLGNYLVAALPNATYIGFTGTPIDRLASGKGTFKVFSADDPQGYLDKYSIAESIADGTTVPLNYALAPSDLRVDRETLDLREAEGVSEQAELDAVLTRAVQLKEMMKAPDRVDKIARFVADHYQSNFLLQQHTQSGDLAPPTVVYEIGQRQLLALRESSADDTVKVLNLRKLLAGLVEEEGAAKPYLLSIGERAQALAEAFDDRQVDTREALKRFEALVQETIDAETRRHDLKLDANGFAIYTALEATTSIVTPAQAQAINGLFGQHPDYRWDDQQESALRAELYKVLRPIVGAGQMVAAANALLRLERV